MNSLRLIWPALLLSLLAGCSEEQAVDQQNDSSTEQRQVNVSPQVQQAAASLRKQSTVLEEELLNITTLVFKAGLPEGETELTEEQTSQIRDLVADGIARNREAYPDFLLVTEEVENKLKDGIAIEDSIERIAAAETFLSEFEIETGGLVKSLMAQYQAGESTPARTELLAQMLTAFTLQAKKALADSLAK